jgi:carbonic anhydrase/acetyltransferase-like protein (isoleucine patch superfamily)
MEETSSTATAKKIRKKRASKHDFKDGLGRVFAHRHANGGGWVADTAKVADTAFVNKFAQVYHHAVVEGRAEITHKAQVCGYAHLTDRVKVTNTAYVGGQARAADDSRVLHMARVIGGTLLGSTVLQDRAIVLGNPTVKSCTMRGDSRIAGEAVVMMTSMEGAAYIAGDAHVCKSTLQGYVTVAGNAQVLSSKLHQLSLYKGNTDTSLLDENRLKVVDFAVIANVESINALLVFGGHCMVIGGRIIFRPPTSTNGYDRISVTEDAIFPAATIERYDQFQAYNVPRSQRARALNHLMPTTQPVNMDALVPARRLMSMGGV